MKKPTLALAVTVLGCALCHAAPPSGKEWIIETQADWESNAATKSGMEFQDGMAVPSERSATFVSKIKSFDQKQTPRSLVVSQSPVWDNWQAAPKIAPANLDDAPVLLTKGPGDYWIFGLNMDRKPDKDPHLIIDADLTDGMPGKDMGMAFDDPSHGSDCAIIRDLDGKFHLISEDWSPIDASKHAWDSPLASHAVSSDGLGNFKLLAPPVDQRTQPTGRMGTFKHPHWTKEDPKNFPSNVAEYEIHEPAQNAYGDWAAIAIGGQYYLFGDFEPAGSKAMSIARFTSADINKPFAFCGSFGSGHPDPDICFAEGRFYLINQTKNDYISPGPWVERVEARVGVDTDNDGKINEWTPWQEVREKYDYIPGFSKQVAKAPATLDLSKLPAGYGFQIELKTTDTTENDSKPILDKPRPHLCRVKSSS